MAVAVVWGERVGSGGWRRRPASDRAGCDGGAVKMAHAAPPNAPRWQPDPSAPLRILPVLPQQRRWPPAGVGAAGSHAAGRQHRRQAHQKPHGGATSAPRSPLRQTAYPFGSLMVNHHSMGLAFSSKQERLLSGPNAAQCASHAQQATARATHAVLERRCMLAQAVAPTTSAGVCRWGCGVCVCTHVPEALGGGRGNANGRWQRSESGPVTRTAAAGRHRGGFVQPVKQVSVQLRPPSCQASGHVLVVDMGTGAALCQPLARLIFRRARGWSLSPWARMLRRSGVRVKRVVPRACSVFMGRR